MENQLIIVSIEDWEGVYYQGKLIYEQHEVRRFKLIDIMKEYNTFDVVEVWLSSEGDEYIQDRGRMPENYDDLIQFLA